MVYVISDIHGEYEAFTDLLEKVNFSEKDELYVLGDCIDRGEKSIEVLYEMMMRPNIYPILGNHEFMALRNLKRLVKEITDENCDEILSNESIKELLLWQNDGGSKTIKQFTELNMQERNDIIEYLGEFALYDEILVNNKSFVLVHAGLDNFSVKKRLEEYTLSELIFKAPDYEKVYFKDRYLVTGHLPTITTIGNMGSVIIKNNHIAIDCGKVFGGRLAMVCLNTFDIYYS